MRTRVSRPRRRLKPKASLPPVEIYTDQRIAEFMLNNAIDARDYAIACEDVRELGLDPAKIRHFDAPWMN
jgi:hypothetical protein